MSTYPSPPALRMPYDRDGSVAFSFETTFGVTNLSTGQMQDINDESDSTHYTFGDAPIASPATCFVGVVFPELRDIAAFFSVITSPNVFPLTWTIQTSADTTTGQDGTWTDRYSTTGFSFTAGSTIPNYRSAILNNPIAAPFPVTGVKGLRVKLSSPSNNAGMTVYSFHVFGYPSAGQNPDSLRPWHPTLDQQADGTTLDFGDQPRGNQSTLTYRVKNISGTKTANAVSITMEALTNASPSLFGQYQLSLSPGGPFTTTLALGTLGPGVTSPLVYVRDTVNGGAATGVWALRLVAAASSFT